MHGIRCIGSGMGSQRSTDLRHRRPPRSRLNGVLPVRRARPRCFAGCRRLDSLAISRNAATVSKVGRRDTPEGLIHGYRERLQALPATVK